MEDFENSKIEVMGDITADRDVCGVNIFTDFSIHTQLLISIIQVSSSVVVSKCMYRKKWKLM